MSNEVVYKVSQISEYVKKIFDSEQVLKYVSMYGEVSGVAKSGGNIYFSLKDENAILSCIAFGTKFEETIKNGEQLVVTGTVRFYVKGGKISVTVIDCQPYGIGELYKRYLELKEKLQNEGLFDVEHKKQIPKLVKRIGVVTSITGAVIQDIINIRTRRNDGVDIVVYPVKVQGLGAENQIAEGINFFSNYKDVDIVIVARGGGSFEDLMPFNTEVVARATYTCKKPIISAVGHETDYTIIDFVSDLRAPTPSAAVELAVLDRNEEINKIRNIIDRLYNVLMIQIDNKVKEINKDVSSIIKYFDTKMNLVETTLISNYKLINTYVNSIIMNKANNLVNLEKLLYAYNPKRILGIGYSQVELNGKIISDIKDIKINDVVSIYLKNGKFKSKIIEKEGEN